MKRTGIPSKWGSRKLWMTLVACGILWAFYELTMRHLYRMPVEKVAAFTAISQTVLCAIAAIAAGYVGVNGLVQMRHGAESAVSQTLSQVVERIPAAKHFDNPEIP